VFLVPTPRFQRSVLVGCPLPPTTKPGLALGNRIEKDRLFAERVRSLAGSHGFPVVSVDGSRSPAQVLAEVEDLLASTLAMISMRGDLSPVRRWQNEVVADNIRRWLASSDAPPNPPSSYPFACECGHPGCTIQLDLALDEYRAMPQVIAPAHTKKKVTRSIGISAVPEHSTRGMCGRLILRD
jgi:hypothetical protein